MEKVRLGDVCEKASSNIAQKDLEGNNGNFPIYGASGFIKNVDFYKQEKEYIAVVKDGAGVGKVLKCPAKSSVIGTLQYILPKENIDIDFLAFAMQNMRLSKYYTGATIPHIYFKDYCKESFLLPVLDEQKNIANILNKITDLIDKRKKQLEKLDELIKSRFVEMFSKKYATRPLESVCEELFAGGDVKKDNLSYERTEEYPYPIYTNGEKNDGLYGYTSVARVEKEAITISGRGTIGFTCLRKEPFYPAIRLIVAIPNQNIISGCYLKHFIQSKEYGGQGASIPQLTVPMIKNEPIPVPPIEEQNKFANFVTQIDKLKSEIQNGLEKLELLKNALMQEYFG